MTLIERLEKAGEGSRELDALICDALIPVRPVRRVVGHGDYDGNAYDRKRLCEASPAWSLDAALALADQVLPGIIWTVCRLPSGNALAKHGPFYATLESDDEWSPTLDQSAATPALALCLAVLRATQETT